MDGQRVNRSGQFLGKNSIHQAMSVDSAFAFEAIRHNIDTKVGFTLRPVSGMTGVKMRFIDNFQARWRKR
jgi:hypothetical protein